MALVKGPNGLVHEIEDSVASSLVGKGNRGYEFVKDEPKKSAAPKPSSAKK